MAMQLSRSAHEHASGAGKLGTVGPPEAHGGDAEDSADFAALLDMFDDAAAFEAPREHTISAVPSPGDAEGPIIVGTSDPCRARVYNVRVGDQVVGVVLVSTGDGTPVLAFVNADQGVAREYYARDMVSAPLGPWSAQQLLVELAAPRFLREHVATVNADALLEQRPEMPPPGPTS
jgi:hypothetical protein